MKQKQKPQTDNKFDQVWTLMKETDRKMQETDRQMKETDRRMAETDRKMQETDRQMKETDRRMAETDRKMQETDRQMKETDRRMAETDRQMKETDRRMKELQYMFTGHWGKLMEALVEGDLVHLLQTKGIQVDRTFPNIKGEFQGQRWEIDILAVNGQEAVVVEVKTTLKQEDVDQFIKLMKLFTVLNPEHKEKKIYGAVAFLKANNSADIYAEKQGLYVIKAVGSSSSIINKKSFKPKAF